eukprot:1789252-Rhodomonas_salina.6
MVYAAGTGIAHRYLPTRLLCDVQYCAAVCFPYCHSVGSTRAMRCPEYVHPTVPSAPLSYAFSMRSPVLTSGVLLPGSSGPVPTSARLNRCTTIPYGLSSYALATRSPVLTSGMLLPG